MAKTQNIIKNAENLDTTKGERMEKYEEITGWLYPQRAEVLNRLIKENDIKTVIEIGCFLGRSTVFFAERCEHVYSIDIFRVWKDYKDNNQNIPDLPNNFFSVFWANIEKAGLTDKVTPIIRSSRKAAKLLPTLSADMIYIDAAHDYKNVLRDINIWLPRAKKVICGDDFDQSWPDVEKAVGNASLGGLMQHGVWYKIIGKETIKINP